MRWPGLDPWWLAALLVWLLPFLLLVPLGLLWLRQEGLVLVWLVALCVLGVAGYWLQSWLRRRELARLATRHTGPDPAWPPVAEGA